MDTRHGPLLQATTTSFVLHIVGCCFESSETGAGSPHRRPQGRLERVMSGELENEGQRGRGGKEREWTDCVAEGRRAFGITGGWSNAALDPGAWYNAVCERGLQINGRVGKGREKASENRQRERKRGGQG